VTRRSGRGPGRGLVGGIAPAPRRDRASRGERPPAPWGRFPLVELCVLASIVLIVVGLLTSGRSGIVLFACGLALGCLGGLELAIREHWAGYRSHTALLALVPTAGAVAGLVLARLPRLAVVPVAVVVFAAAFFALRAVFKRRSGGFGFR
jgi:hypothetical protein